MGNFLLRQIFCGNVSFGLSVKMWYNNKKQCFEAGDPMSAVGGRQYQDSVFRMYFNNTERLRELAGVLHGCVYAVEEPLEIVTLEGTFLSQVKNDVSFLLAGRYLVFLEHQSTMNHNMALRCLYQGTLCKKENSAAGAGVSRVLYGRGQ